MEAPTARDSVPKPGLFQNRHFRNLILGGMISMLGDQFYLIALPWLVLQITGSSVALGTVLTLAAVPRAVLMLLGGAVSDRTSPRRLLLLTACARTILVAAIAILGWNGMLSLWHLYVLAFAFGLADAFAIPALQALLPVLVSKDQLVPANSVLQSSMQLSMIAGPPPAGFIIKQIGTMWAFFIDAVSFLFIIAPLAVIPDPPKTSTHHSQRGVWHDLLEGLRYVHADIAMRTLMGFGASLNFFIMGPVMVGLAAVAKNHFHSSTAYGLMFAAFAAGGLAGGITAGLRKQRRRGLMVLLLGATLGLLFVILGFLLHSLPGMCLDIFFMGIASGYCSVHLTAWYQERIQPQLMGRVMSLRMFTIFGLMPVSLAISGFVADASLPLLFVASGVLLLAVTLLASTQAPVRALD